ncbi:MAG: type VI secretion protein IcmF/TssM N-terminal domain-containing protein [Gemmataceae bacterium]
MQSLIYAFVWFVDRIRSLVGMVLPIFADAADFRSWPKWVKVLVHCIILGIILFGLFLLNQYDFIQDLLKTKGAKGVNRVYLPLVFLLIYCLTWIGYFWWKLFNSKDAAQFPEIASAWYDALEKLNKAGISLGDAPLYIVIGKPNGGEDSIFVASGQKIEVRAPLQSESPIRIYAGPSAIYVTCTGASTWGRFSEALSNPDAVGIEQSPTDTSGGKTITPDKALSGVDDRVQEEFYALLKLQSERPLSIEEETRLKEVGDAIQKTKSELVRRVSLSADELSNGPRRLAYLCQLIAESRRPWCPINGMLILIPWATLDSDEVSRTAVSVLSTDLAAARNALQERYPHFVLVCDMEEAAGFDEFRRGFPREMLRQRIGQRLPMIPDRPAEEMPSMMEAAADWIRQNVLASWVLKFLRLEWPPEQRKTNQFVPTYNRKLFHFLHDLYVRGPRLGRLLARGLPADTTSSAEDPTASLQLLGGCYLAATGKDEKNQAFVPGVFQRLTESQSSVSWSTSAFADDRSNHRWATGLYIVAVLVTAATIYMAYQVYKVYGQTIAGK